MAPRASSISVPAIVPLVQRQQSVRRESLRDFGGVALGVIAGALVWLVFLSLARLSA